LDVLITSIRSLNTKGVAVTLDVYGAGDVSQFDFDQSSINYCGLIPFGEAQSIIANYDVLVLPSRYDGWGVVVNEAIIAGVPVICSNRVGAGAVVEKWQCGAIFTSEDVSDLERIVNEIVFTTESLEKMRIASRNASAVIDPKVAGRYMFDVLKADTLSSKQQMPSCPWYEH
jgi:glycosyltransferase involved in cell wall biosynthesis